MNNRIGGVNPEDRNLISGVEFSGIEISGDAATANMIEGNLIGTDVSGLLPLANGDGVLVRNDAFENTIGGAVEGAGNVVSASTNTGITLVFGANNNTVQGNTVGLGVDGTTTLGNEDNGVALSSGAFANLIGGTDEDAGNLIGGNSDRGIVFFESSDNIVQGNAIGTDFNGTLNLANSDGVRIASTSNNNLIGGTVAGAGNIIAFNNGLGIFAEDFNSPVGNVFSTNRVFSNLDLGIDLGFDFVTPNDPGDGDGGANNSQNFPVITLADSGTDSVDGTLNSLANRDFRLEFFSNSTADPSGFGEGEVYLGTMNVSTNASGDSIFTFNSPVDLIAGAFITATATLLDAGGELVETSEFSGAFEVQAGMANDPPEITDASTDATFDNKALPNETVVLTANFTDPNPGDTHTATIDWGDGMTTPGGVDQLTGTVTGTHEYTTGGIFTVTVTVTDSEGESDVETTTAVVTGVRLTDAGELQIVGTSERDKIHVFRFGSWIKVHAKLDGDHQHFSFHKNDVTSILVFSCEGNDHVHISHHVHKPATINAGAGRDHVIGGGGDDLIRGGDDNDHIWAGWGNDIVLGEAGNDFIVGGFGRDILIGGLGRDWVFGTFGDDIVIGGTTDHDANDAALLAIMAEWSSSNSFNTRVSNIRNGGGLNGANVLDDDTVNADGEVDYLFGILGKDWIWAESIDHVFAGFGDLVDFDDT